MIEQDVEDEAVDGEDDRKQYFLNGSHGESLPRRASAQTVPGMMVMTGGISQFVAFLWGGGPVMAFLIVLSVLILATGVYCYHQFITLRTVNHPVHARMQELLRLYPRLDADDAFDLAVYGLRRAVHWLAYLAHIATLSGLLGTVLGIRESFSRLSGANTAMLQIIASGIDQAIATTIVGLSLAIPALLLHYYFRDQLRRAELELPLQFEQRGPEMGT